jgi:hypothetical protein
MDFRLLLGGRKIFTSGVLNAAMLLLLVADIYFILTQRVQLDSAFILAWKNIPS